MAAKHLLVGLVVWRCVKPYLVHACTALFGPDGGAVALCVLIVVCYLAEVHTRARWRYE